MKAVTTPLKNQIQSTKDYYNREELIAFLEAAKNEDIKNMLTYGYCATQVLGAEKLLPYIGVTSILIKMKLLLTKLLPMMKMGNY